MKRKTVLLAFVILALILPSTISGSPFYYITGTLVEDKKYDHFDVIIEEGYYFLVFDNTGYITDNYTRLDSYVIYTLDFGEAGVRDIDGQKPVKAGEYALVSFNFDLAGVIVTELYFEMIASERLSAFLTNSDGLAQYFHETGELTKKQRQEDLIIISSVLSSTVGLLLITIVVMRYNLLRKIKRRYQAYRNRKVGRKFKNIG